MYFPYLRGRQYELLAVRELIENKLIGSRVTPVIEPITPTATLVRTLQLCEEKGKKIGLIHNPQVGTFLDELLNMDSGPIKDGILNVFDGQHVMFSHIMNHESEGELGSHNEVEQKKDMLVILNNEEYMDGYLKFFGQEPPQFTLVADEGSYRKGVGENPVLLMDRFKKQEKNGDYRLVEDEFYSADHLLYSHEGYVGFSDYSIVGAEFSEMKSVPAAVAIHMVYFDGEENLRIKHFVSDSNEDHKDNNRKFYGALEKLMAWQEEVKLDTHGMKELVKHYTNEAYPDLGILKKLSIMHHLELVNRFLEKKCLDL